MKGTASRHIYQLKVILLEVEPAIWRRVQVRGTVTLAKLHAILQDVMGWTNSHLYAFHIAGKTYQEPDPEAEGLDARKALLGRLSLKTGDVFEYHYDFGDDWRHGIFVEKVLPPSPDGVYPACLDGARACPMEDWRGPARLRRDPRSARTPDGSGIT